MFIKLYESSAPENNRWLVKDPFELRLLLNNVPLSLENIFGIWHGWVVSGNKPS